MRFLEVPEEFRGEKKACNESQESLLPARPISKGVTSDSLPKYCITCRGTRSPALAAAEAEAESPHLEIISPPGLLGLKEEARRNVVEILEKPESRSSDSSFTEALRFYTQPECS